MKYIAVVFFLVFSNISSKGQDIDTILNEIDKKNESLIEQYEAVGLSVAVVKDNKVIYSKGFGYRDLEEKLLVNENTVFHIALIEGFPKK